MCNVAFFRGPAHRCSANTVPLAATPLQSVLLTKLFSCDCSPFADFIRSLRPLRVCRALTYVLAALAVSPTWFLRRLPLPALTPAHHHLPISLVRLGTGLLLLASARHLMIPSRSGRFSAGAPVHPQDLPLEAETQPYYLT